MPDASAELRDRVMAALGTVSDKDGVIVYGEGRVLAYRDPHPVDGAAVLIALSEEETPTRKHPVAHLPADGERPRWDARTHPVQLDLPER